MTVDLDLDLDGCAERLARDHAIPGVTLGVLRGDQVSVGCWGVLDTASGAPVSPRTPFPLASITKVMTATLAVGEAERRGISLDAELCDLLPDLGIDDLSALQGVTLRHLLTHTSGIEGDVFVDTGDGPDALARYVTRHKSWRRLHPPGVAASYCNTGMVVLGHWLETVLDRPWEEVMASGLADPLNLHRTTAFAPTAQPRCAGHSGPPENRLPVDGPPMPRSVGPAGTAWSTPHEVLTWARAHLAHGAAQRQALGLSDASVARMQRREIAVPGPAWLLCPQAWGLGWSLYDWGGRRVIGHDGGGPGTASVLRIMPTADAAVVALVNAGDRTPAVGRAVAGLIEQVTGAKSPEELQPSARRPRPAIPEGPYVSSSSRFRVVFSGDDCVRLVEEHVMPGGEQGSREMVLRPGAGSGVFHTEPVEGFDISMPVVFMTLPDRRPVMHMAGRVAVFESA